MKQIENRQNIFLFKFKGGKHYGQRFYRIDKKKKEYKVLSEKRRSRPDNKTDY